MRCERAGVLREPPDAGIRCAEAERVDPALGIGEVELLGIEVRPGADRVLDQGSEGFPVRMIRVCQHSDEHGVLIPATAAREGRATFAAGHPHGWCRCRHDVVFECLDLHQPAALARVPVVERPRIAQHVADAGRRFFDDRRVAKVDHGPSVAPSTSRPRPHGGIHGVGEDMVLADLTLEDGLDDAPQVGEGEVSIDDDVTPDLGDGADEGEAEADGVAEVR